MQKIKYNIHALYLSLYSKIFYWDLLKNRKNIGLSYVVLLAVITGLASSFVLSKIIISAQNNLISEYAIEDVVGKITNLNEDAKDKISQFPKFKIAGNGIQFNSDQPKIIGEVNSGGFLLIFDPTNKINANTYDQVVIINTSKIIAKNGQNEQVFYLEKLQLNKVLEPFINEDGYIDNYSFAVAFLNILQAFAKFVPVIVFFASLFASLFSLAFSVMFFSFVANLMFKIMGVQSTNFRNSIRLSAYSFTPVFILDLIQLIALKQIFGAQFLVYFVLHLVYMYYAIDALKDIEKLKKTI
jgi:hypothetical protein